REYHVLTPGVLADRPPDDLLRAAVPVDVGGVPERDAEFHGLPEDRLGRLIVQRPLVESPRGVAETHATQRDPADLQARSAQTGVLHRFPSVPGRGVSAVVGELERDAEVLALEQGDDRLQVILLLAGDPQLVALDLRLHALGPAVADGLADRLGLLLIDPLDDPAVDLVGLAGLLRLARVEGLQG